MLSRKIMWSKDQLVSISLHPTYNHLQKTLEKLRKFRKSSNHKQNINGIYYEKLHNNCLQQLPTLRFKIRRWGGLGAHTRKKKKKKKDLRS